MERKILLSLVLSMVFWMPACLPEDDMPQSTQALLTSHKWQLVEESGLNLPQESLRDNIIELNANGSLIYYENEENIQVFTENSWNLSEDGQKIIEVFPDDTKIISDILEVNTHTLKLRYKEANGVGEYTTVVETYHRFAE